MANEIETISYINLGDGNNHPIDAVTVGGITLTSAEKALWNGKQDALTFDSEPTENSNNLVKSGALYSVITDNELVTAAALNDLNDRMLDVEESMSSVLVSETDPVFSASPAASITASNISSWNAKQDALTFDSIPTENSDNLVKSGPLYTVLTNTELVVATAINDLNERILSVDSSISEVYEEIDRALTAVLTYRGTVGSNGDVSVLPSSHEVGDVYVVSVAGTYAGQACEVGDYIICKTSGTSASDGDWNVVNGENQVSNSAASLAAPGSSVTIATVDGTNITISTPASWTGVSKNGTLTGVTFNGVSASVSNGVASISLTFDSIPTENSDNLVKSGDLYDVIVSNERVVATALNDVNDRLLAVENVSTTHISGITLNGVSASVSNGVASISATIPAYFVINGDNYSYTSSSDYEAYVDFGNIVTAVSFNGTNVSLSNGRVSISETDPVFMSSPAYTITSAMISSWNAKQNALVFDSIPTQNSDNLVKSGVLYSVITDNELVVSTALNDLNDRVSDLENNTGSGGITGVMFNGVSASISDGVASISASIPAAVTSTTVAGWGFITSESDPVFTSSVAASISAADITNWNSKGNAKIFYGTCSTTGATAAKIVDCSTFTSADLVNGALIFVTFSETNTATPVTLTMNVNSTGAKSIRKQYSAASVTYLTGGQEIQGNVTYLFTYNGSSWVCMTLDYNTTYPTMTEASAIAGTGTIAGLVSPSVLKAAITANAPAAITESDVAGWGFTKNAGTLTGVTYNGVSTSVSNGVVSINARIPSYIAMNGNAYTYTESSDYEAFFDIGDVVTAVSFNGTSVNPSSGVVTISESDPVFSASVAASISAADISNWNSKTSNTGTITGISMNGSSKGTTGNVNLGTVVTAISMNSTAVSISNGIANLGTVLTSHQSIKTINSQAMTGSGNVTIREIPACTSSDNGKVLQVVNGSWTLVTPVSIYSGSSNPDNTQGTNGDLYLQTS